MQFIEHFRHFGMRQYIMRLVAAFLIGWFALLNIADVPFTDISFYGTVGFGFFLGCVIVMFAGLCFVPSDTLITIVIIAVAELYFMFTARDIGDYWFSLGLSAVMCTLVVFFDLYKPKRDLNGLVTKFICVFLMIAAIVFVGGICCLYVLNHLTPCYDFGLFAQMFHYMKETGECLSTCERDGLLNHFAVHFSPIYYVILPFYMLIPSPCTLVVAQAVIVASGVVPLVLLCKKFKLSNIAAVSFSVIYLLYPAFLGAQFWYLHENCFLAPMLLWYMYFSEKKNAAGTLIFAFASLLIKEDAAVYVAVIALYFIFSKRNIKHNLYVIIWAVAYFIVVTELMGVFGEGIMSDSRYGEYIYDGGGIFTVIKAVLQNPAYAIKQIFRQEKILFILQIFTPLCFLPLAIKKQPAKLILFIPFLLVNLMTNYIYQFDIGFQYTFGSATLLIYLAISNYAEMGENRRKMLICGVLSSAILFAGGFYRKTEYIETYKENAEQRETINEALAMIPEDKSVAATTFLITSLSHLDEIYELETTKHETDYVAVDLRFSSNKQYADECEKDGFEEVFYKTGVIVIYERVTE